MNRMLINEEIYKAPWEKKYEKMGPMKERVHPNEHVCIAVDINPEIHRLNNIIPLKMNGGFTYILDVVLNVIKGKSKIIDMGGGKRRALPGALDWSLENGYDMTNIEQIKEIGEKFDLIFSSHSIEHVESDLVLQMLSDWHDILTDEGEIFIAAPHRCSSCWSLIYNQSVGEPAMPYKGAYHQWCPTASCIGNFLINEKHMTILDYQDHLCMENLFWIWLTK